MTKELFQEQKMLSEENEITLLEYIENKNCRLELLKYLNVIRAKGNFLINKPAFKEFGKIVLHIVDLVSKDKDFESMRYCIIISQTYFFMNKKKQKIYLSRYIDNHELFKSTEFWEFYLSDSIFLEVEKIEKANKAKEESEVNNKEDDEELSEIEKKKSYNNVIFSKILSIAHNMMEFQVEKKLIKTLIHAFCSQYDVPQESEDEINQVIDLIEYEHKEPFNEETDLIEPEPPKKQLDPNNNANNNIGGK